MNPPSNALFPGSSQADWIAQVGKDLKDPNAYETLRWRVETSASAEGFVVEPFYTRDQLTDVPWQTVQAVQKAEPGWLNTPVYHLTGDTKVDNKAITEQVSSGADALILASGRAEGAAIADTSQLSRLLNGIKLSETPLFFDTTDSAADLLNALRTVAPYQLKGGLLSKPDETTAQATRLSADSPQFRTVCVSGHDFHNAGATAVQELAFLLARLTDTYDPLTEQGLTPEQLGPKTILSVAVGTSYFLEIAKLRALRVLWARFGAGYGISVPAFIHAQTSAFYESTATPYTNLLRATTEAMSATVGGCDLLTVRPFNALTSSSDAFGQRIARNVSLLLTEESYFNRVADPAAGSYYIETLTHQLTEAAWQLFLDVEAKGGLAKATDWVKTEIDAGYAARVQAVVQGKVLVGVNKFRFDEGVQADKPVVAQPSGEGLPVRRLAESFE
ncbi:methylmalonyl-CoA mutase [Rudanella paleaurantiibacter]|uniref:Methylmalonyl-CoA mutase n=1 Tax=Rudanella paleaurantiibacter TaxID=2614655 RepID=A0A7J5TZ12_9BACT|nr:methylmalonyl-CoA mutase family protein [Rudanella paleaurantiibacter]KAB7730372.1 methylmalonyl-CoA mutase [Rudanella paleaurantiibacter]